MSKSDDRKGVVFTHFMRGGSSVYNPGHVRGLRAKWRARLESYAKCKSTIDRVFVFISEGYQALASIRKREAPFVALQTDRHLIQILREESQAAGCSRNFVVPIGFEALVNVLSKLQRRAAEANRDISLLLLGSGEYMRYDSPKIVDAILRIAGRNTGRPMFRIDDDVEPSNDSFKKLLEAFQKMPNRSLDAIYAFSGGYGGWDCSNPSQLQNALLNNYAVRTSHLSRNTDSRWELDSVKVGAFLKGLSSIGAEQGFSTSKDGGNKVDAQVISGAGLCLSYAAVRKLPPFANLDNAITWIDDHLKRKMHEALGDLGPNKSTVRVVDALFKQDRHPGGLADADMKAEGAQYYLSTLARGCIFDSIIQSKGKVGPYTEYIAGWLNGNFDFPEIFSEPRRADGSRNLPRPLTDFGMELAEVGASRIELVAKQWRSQVSGERLAFKDGELFVPNDAMPCSILLPPVFGPGAKTVMSNAKTCLVYQVLEDAEQYLELLRIWPSFVGLLEEITGEGRDWLFDRFDDDTDC